MRAACQLCTRASTLCTFQQRAARGPHAVRSRRALQPHFGPLKGLTWVPRLGMHQLEHGCCAVRWKGRAHPNGVCAGAARAARCVTGPETTMCLSLMRQYDASPALLHDLLRCRPTCSCDRAPGGVLYFQHTKDARISA